MLRAAKVFWRMFGEQTISERLTHGHGVDLAFRVKAEFL